jgi:hypothetical protein
MKPRYVLEALAAVPGAAAVFLGVLYTLGVTARASSFTNNDVSAVTTLQLVPLDQLLAAGMGIALKLALIALLGIMVGLVVALAGAVPTTRQRLLEGTGVDVPRNAISRWVLVLLAVLVAVLSVVASPPVSAALIVDVAVFVIVARRGGFEGRRPVFNVSLGLILSGSLLVGAVAEQFEYPEPLPYAEVSTVQAGTVRGKLLAVAGGTWYVRTRRGQIEAIPTGRISRTRVIAPVPEGPRSTFEAITGWDITSDDRRR